MNCNFPSFFKINESNPFLPIYKLPREPTLVIFQVLFVYVVSAVSNIIVGLFVVCKPIRTLLTVSDTPLTIVLAITSKLPSGLGVPIPTLPLDDIDIAKVPLLEDEAPIVLAT